MQKHTLRQRAKALAIVLHKGEQKAAGVFLVLTILLAVLYVYFVGTAVVHAVARKEVQQDLAQFNSRVAELEVDYLSRKNKVTTEMAVEMGLEELTRKDYVERARYLGRASAQ
ncbi:hypothetical protein CL652_03335 [bacterium]|nr:hypothetical protein [bacterium]|tara:strand:- start:3187 stop:3525 length:339 start_codon:yes stop_codon:yes gene_type:complete